MPRILLAACAACLLTACGHVPLSSLPRIARIDIMTTDPARLRIAVRLPKDIRPQPGGIAMTLTVQIAGEAPQVHRLALMEISDTAEAAALAAYRDAGRTLHAFGLAAADARRFSDVRAAILARRGEGKNGSLSIGVSPETCRTGELPPGPLFVDSYLRTSELPAYVPLTRDVDLRRMEGRDVAALIPPCAAPKT